MLTKKIKILAFAGSLRKKSYNKLLLQATQSLVSKKMEINIFDLAAIPLYNMDLENGAIPPVVNQFRSAIGEADALLIAVPEHNGTISAVLKNAIEWASRRNANYLEYTQKRTPFYRKPVTFIGASTSYFATIRAQTHLLYICSLLEMHPMGKPCLTLANAQDCFNDEGILTDTSVVERLTIQLDAFHKWIISLK